MNDATQPTTTAPATPTFVDSSTFPQPSGAFAPLPPPPAFPTAPPPFDAGSVVPGSAPIAYAYAPQAQTYLSPTPDALAIAGLVVGYIFLALILLGIGAIVLLVTPVNQHGG